MYPLSTLLKSGFTPTLKELNNFLLHLSRNQRFRTVVNIFSQLTSNKITTDAQTHSIFAEAVLKEHKYEEAADFLRALVGKSKIFNKNHVFDSVVQGICTVNQDPERGLSLLKDFLKAHSFLPSSRTFCLLICYFSQMGKMERVIDLLELISDDKFKYPFINYVCSSVISGFVRIGEPELAVGFYETAMKSGSFTTNTVTCTALLTAYYRIRDVDKVSHLISWMENNEFTFDVVFYSSWMHGCLSEGLINEAFKGYRAMGDKKVELDIISYTILIDGFSKNGLVEKGVGFLHKMRSDGLVPNLVTYTAIILGFCKKGKLKEAFAIFNLLNQLGIEADEFVYAILIHGVCRMGDFDLVFHLLDEMEKKGINPGVVTYNTVINGLCKAGRTSEADDFSKGIVGDVITYSTLLHGYVQEQNNSGILEMKKRLEAENINMDVVICNILIKAMLMVGLFEDALAIFKGLTQMNLSANSVTYITLIDGYCKARRIYEALEIFDQFQRNSNPPASCYKRIILGLCTEGIVDMAIDIFMGCIQKGLQLERSVHLMLIEAIFNNKGAEGVIEMLYKMEDMRLLALQNVYNDSILFLCERGFPEASYRIISSLRSKGLASARMGYYSILRALLFESKRLLAQLILTSFLKTYGLSDHSVCEVIVNYLCLSNIKKALLFLSTINEKRWSLNIPFSIFNTLIKDGRILDAYELMVGAENHLSNMNVIDYTIMIDALCRARHISKALNVSNLAKKKGVSLNVVTYNSVINGLCRQGCLVEAFRLFDSLERINVLPTEITYGTLIDALVREGLLQDARILFERMFLKDLKPSTHIYNSLIDGYCKSSLLEEAIKLFQELEVRNIQPDGFTVSALINGYCEKGDMEGALNLFLDFKSMGLLPDYLGFMYLLRGLCAKGRMEESRSIIREMLQTQSVIDLFERLDTAVESDSVKNLLVSLCEQGRINDAVALLNEIGSQLFSLMENSSHFTSDKHKLEANNEVVPSMYGGTDIQSPSSDVEKVEGVVEMYASKEEVQQLEDFDSFYSLIHSLCSKGELAKANTLTRLVMKS